MSNFLAFITASAAGAGGGSDPILDARTTAYLTAGGSALNDAFAVAINDYVLAIDAADAFDTDEEHYILASKTEAQAYINLINPAQSLTKTGAVTFTQYESIAGDGSTGYLTCAVNVDAYTKFSQADGHLALATVNASVATISIEVATADLSMSWLSRNSDADDLWVTVFGTAYHPTLEGLTPPLGTFGYHVIDTYREDTLIPGTINGTALNASALNVGVSEAGDPAFIGYQDGERFSFEDIGNGNVVATTPMVIGAAPIAALFSTRKYGLFHVGARLTDGQVAARATAFEALQTALSAI